MASHQEWLLCYKGDVLVFRSSPGHAAGKGPAEPPWLQARRMTFDRETGTFVQKATSFVSLQEGDGPAQIMCCNCVSDFRTGMNVPCVLVQCTEKCDAFIYILLFLHWTDTFEKRLRVRLNYQLHEFRVLNGPVLLWKHVQTFYYISSKADQVITVPIKLSTLNWAGEIEDVGLALLGIKDYSLEEEVFTRTTSKFDLAVQNTRFCLFSLESQDKLSDSYIIPAGYTSAITFVHVCSSEFVNGQFRISLIVLTEKNQLISFQNGIPQGVCQFPFGDPCSVQLMEGGEDLVYLVSFKSNKACAVWNKNFQIAAKWDNINSVLIDDFVGTGTEQVLLFFKDSWNSDGWSSFQITNFVDINYPTDPVEYIEDDLEDDKEKNHCLVIPPLRRRVQIGMASIQDWKQHILLKEKFISKCCETFLNLVQGKDDCTSRNQEDCLVTLCGNEETSVSMSDEKPSGEIQLSEEIVEKIWYRILDDNLVVGVKTTSSLLSLNHVTLSLLMWQTKSSSCQPIKCRNRVIQLRRESLPVPVYAPSDVGSKAKRIKLMADGEGERTSYLLGQHAPEKEKMTCVITAVTALSPLLAFGDFCCVVLLQFSRAPESGSTSEGGCVQCGRISLSLEDLSRAKYLVTFPEMGPPEHVEDIFALLAAFHQSCLQVSSPTYVLTSVKPWLMHHMQCEGFREFPEIWFCKRSGSVYGTLFKWEQTTPFEGVLFIYYRNYPVLFQCLHHLMTVLPVDAFIKHLKSGRENTLLDQLAWSLEKESNALSSLSSALATNGHENSWFPSCQASKEETSNDSALVLSKKDIHLLRRELEEKKQQTEEAWGTKVSGALYREMIVRLTDMELDSDLIVQKLTHF
ncbi:Fanconi anemia group B protein [Suncus etruscus]|uniref:Fanconi anemia group B protein n=1 Tax=Suncus etruscus TaxID=109475 RepID=UPI00210FB60E|nr:Fanconi anemia group B protein [Suncus etruscus]